MRQIFDMKRVIEIRINDEAAVQAKLHGMQIKQQPQSLGITREKRAEYNKDADRVLERLKRKHKEYQDGLRQ